MMNLRLAENTSQETINLFKNLLPYDGKTVFEKVQTKNNPNVYGAHINDAYMLMYRSHNLWDWYKYRLIECEYNDGILNMPYYNKPLAVVEGECELESVKYHVDRYGYYAYVCRVYRRPSGELIGWVDKGTKTEIYTPIRKIPNHSEEYKTIHLEISDVVKKIDEMSFDKDNNYYLIGDNVILNKEKNKVTASNFIALKINGKWHTAKSNAPEIEDLLKKWADYGGPATTTRRGKYFGPPLKFYGAIAREILPPNEDGDFELHIMTHEGESDIIDIIVGWSGTGHIIY